MWTPSVKVCRAFFSCFPASSPLLLLSSCCIEEAVPSHLVHTSPKAFMGPLGHHAVVKAIINALKCNLDIWCKFWCCLTGTWATTPTALFLVWMRNVNKQSHKWVVQMTSGALSSWVASFPSSFGRGLAPHGHLKLRTTMNTCVTPAYIFFPIICLWPFCRII